MNLPPFLLAHFLVAQIRLRFAIVGVPEDIGVRANLGRAGARDGWAAFLPAFAAMQSNASLRGEGIAVLGQVAVDDIMERAERDGYSTIA